MSHSCEWLVLGLLCSIGAGSVLDVELEAGEVWEEQAAAYDWVGLDCVFVWGGNWVLVSVRATSASFDVVSVC